MPFPAVSDTIHALPDTLKTPSQKMHNPIVSKKSSTKRGCDAAGDLPDTAITFLLIYAYGQLSDHKPAPVPPFHAEAVRVFGTVPFAGFFFTGYGRCGGEFFPRLSCIAPAGYRV
jgi:hypothetical protein